jgi:TrmH family RNA methyltransferase
VFYARDSVADAATCALLDDARTKGVRVFSLDQGVLERISDTVTPQGIVGIVGIAPCPLDSLRSTGLVVVLEDVRDPGNVGAIVRSADAAGADAVICLAGTSDLYNPKVVRASAGSLFHLPVVVDADVARVIGFLRARRCSLLASVATGGFDYAIEPWPDSSALVLGNEASGISTDLRAQCDGAISIPIAGAAESLNVAMASAVLLFEAARRKRTSR